MCKGAFFVLVVLVLNVLCFAAVWAQDQENAYAISLSGQGGFIIAHKPEMQHVAQSHPLGTTLDIVIQTRGKRDWHHAYNFPAVGFSASYIHLGAPRLLGEAWAITSYMEPFVLRGTKHQLSYKIGTGLVYLNTPFDIQHNHTNIAISSSLNYVIQAGLTYTYMLNNRYYLLTGVDMIHFSNGAMKMPNAGINIPALRIGIGSKLSEIEPLPARIKLSPVDKKLSFDLLVSGGLIENAPLSSKTYGSWTLSAYSSQRISRKSVINIGVDGFYNLALKAYLGKYPDYQHSDFRRIGLAAGHELMISKLSLLTQAGYYLYMPPKIHSRFYQRYGLRYSFYQNYFGSIMLKAHLGRAEMVEWGIGVRL